MDVAEIRSKVNKLHWFQGFELVPGVMTPGVSIMSERVSYFQIPQDLTGKRVLDIGCNDGYFTFLAESRGATVVAIDAWPRDGFFLAQEVLGSKAEFHHMSVYDIHPDVLGTFDIVFFFGVYYHLKHPLLAMERVAGVTRDYAIVESEIMDLPHPRNAGFSRFYEHDELVRGDPSNWWVPNIPCLIQTTRAAGFPRVEFVGRYGNRGLVRAHKGPRTAGKKLDENIVVAVDASYSGPQANGTIQAWGWALDQVEPQDGIEQVWIFLDNLDDPASELGQARYNLVQDDPISYIGPRYGNVGFQGTFDARGIRPGRHDLLALAVGKTGWNYRPVSLTIGPVQTQPEPDASSHASAVVNESHPSAPETDERLAAYDAEIARLRTLVDGYERGRFMRLMRWLHNSRKKVGL